MLQAGLKVNKLSAVDGRSLSNEELKAVSTPMAMLLQPRGETSPLIRMFTLSLLNARCNWMFSKSSQVLAESG